MIEIDDEMAGEITEGDENNELYEHFRFQVDKGQALLRIDKFLQNRIEGISRNRVQNAAKAGNILVNDDAVKSNYRIKPLDIISVVMATPPRQFEVIAENLPLNIVYEDDDLMVINKEFGMVVHPAHGNYTGTMLNALTYHLQDQVNSRGDPVAPFLVHRIDKDTSGIILCAKTELAQTILARQFFHHTIDRRYIALVWGEFNQDEGTITGNIGRNPSDRKVMTVREDETFGRKAITHYKVIERFHYVTLVECRLETGRTHQIRAHFKYIGHPLFGDQVYGGAAVVLGLSSSSYQTFVRNNLQIIPRQALHAKSLAFTHPITHKLVFFDSDLPYDMQRVIERWRRYTDGSGRFTVQNNKNAPADHIL
ncbi:MAG: RNA pseudouridine synthase [Bacteroidetes bacterium HGW-Bacteroidetes-22]|nr:MAG: RNA pseudouridine synthase [Bacteroidetes bacterium HGW-Bacteroidetes-22]